MNKIVSAVKTFIADENGVTAIEYGLLAAILGAAVIAGGTLVKDGLSSAFGTIKTALTTTR